MKFDLVLNKPEFPEHARDSGVSLTERQRLLGEQAISGYFEHSSADRCTFYTAMRLLDSDKISLAATLGRVGMFVEISSADLQRGMHEKAATSLFGLEEEQLRYLNPQKTIRTATLGEFSKKSGFGISSLDKIAQEIYPVGTTNGPAIDWTQGHERSARKPRYDIDQFDSIYDRAINQTPDENIKLESEILNSKLAQILGVTSGTLRKYADKLEQRGRPVPYFMVKKEGLILSELGFTTEQLEFTFEQIIAQRKQARSQ